ncbi:MAG: cell division protein ZapE [Gammaproteobacteria bacterium]|nr:cell division protein ZapE [Gammaproteobacteria bacterium]
MQHYEQVLACRRFVPDRAQREAVGLTQSLHESLIAEHARRNALLGRLRRRLLGEKEPPCRGLYLWGGVGRGKTWIADAFYECLPFERKLRMHFHRFMQHIHRELRGLRQIEDPLRIVADRLAERTLVLCFDEFHVSDITDAMLIGNLLGALFDRGVCLVATSNEHPDRLYHGGLQRDRFLPAIDLIKERTQVVNLDSGVDYRMRYLDHARIFHFPLDGRADAVLHTHFDNLAPEAGSRNTTIEIENRRIPIVRRADGVVWFDFQVICGGPRSMSDYIEIARQFQTVLVGNVPRMEDGSIDSAQRFIHLVDELYDRNVRLMLSADAPPDGLYAGRRLAQPFLRTASRLVEMQSHAYLARGHRSD